MGKEPDEFDNCLKNLKLKVNFVKEIIIRTYLTSFTVPVGISSSMTTHMPSLPELDD